MGIETNMQTCGCFYFMADGAQAVFIRIPLLLSRQSRDLQHGLDRKGRKNARGKNFSEVNFCITSGRFLPLPH